MELLNFIVSELSKLRMIMKKKKTIFDQIFGSGYNTHFPKLQMVLLLCLTTSFGFSNEIENDDTVLGPVGLLEAVEVQLSVSGTVVDDAGTPLPGATVIEKGTSNGTQTDFDGNFILQVSNGQATIVVSYIGYEPVELPLNGQTSVSVALNPSTSQLDEVVIVGYGSVKKSDITGSVASVDSEELNAFPVLNAEQAIQGRAAGVVVQANNGGEPGSPISINIRGNTSIGANSAALIVVDGFVGAQQLPLASDIESIEILKDASATAIYGSRGSGGVILVTTKKGTKGRMTVELNSTYSVQEVTERLDLLNADQFFNYYTQINPAYQQGPVDTDWQDLILRSGSTQNHQLSFSGGSDNMNYYISGNYFNQKGVVINSDFERFSFIGNIESQISDKLKIGLNMLGNRNNQNGVASQPGNGGRGDGDVIAGAYRFVPDLGVQDENGVNTQQVIGDDFDNPVAVANETVDETTTDDFRANFYADYEIIKGLSFKTTFGYDVRNETRGIFRPSTLVATAGIQGGIGSIETTKFTNLLSENYLTYNLEFDKASLTVLAGYSYQKETNEFSSASAQGFPSNSFSYRNLRSGSTPLPPSSFLSEREIVSQFGRLNFDYDNRYLLTLTARRDGSSAFSENEKYAFFPSGAIAWRLSNEAFLENSKTISNLKLRASYGVTGNQAIDPYQSLAQFRTIYSVVGDQTVNAFVPDQLANPDLKWESSYQTNIGLDLGLFKERVALTLDYYRIDTEDVILGDTSSPEYFGTDPEVLRNVGEIKNTGFEVTLSTRNIVTDNFTWFTDFNWSTNENTVESLINGEDVFLNSAPGSFLNDQTHILREGEPVGVFWGWEYQGVNQGTAPAGTAGFDGFQEAGDELFTDLNDDGVINSDDRTIIGDPNPDWTAGLNNTFTYKDFDLNIFFQAAVGGDIFSYTLLELASGQSNATTEALDVWTPSNTDTNVPSAKTRQKRNTSRFVYDGSYVRLKNLSLGYNLPSEVVSRLGMQRARVSLSGQNLLTFTDFPGTDPEANYRDSNVNRGFQYGSYPNIRSITLALNLTF